MSPQVRAELLAPFAEDVAPGTEWAVLAGIGAANVRELLHIIDRMGREARRMRGQLAEFAAASADATRAEMARQGITGKELAK
jgi:hypothetical protein